MVSESYLNKLLKLIVAPQKACIRWVSNQKANIEKTGGKAFGISLTKFTT